jgi:hypothetical protein
LPLRFTKTGRFTRKREAIGPKNKRVVQKKQKADKPKPIVDFTEIPQSGTGNGDQDDFEFFAQAFLISQGFEVVRKPARGVDGGVDMIVLERRAFPETIRWLVSAKHKAHGGRAVSNRDEPNISDDVRANACDGFLGIYSTIMTSRLEKTLRGIAENTEIKTDVLQSRELEGLIIQDSSPTSVFASYFPKSYAKFMKKHPQKSTTKKKADKVPSFIAMSEAMAIMRIHEARVSLMGMDDLEEAEVFKSLMAYSYTGSVRVFQEVVTFAEIVLAGETKHTRPEERERPSLVYYVLTKFLMEKRLFTSYQDYGSVMREIVYLGTRYVLRRSYYHDDPLPGADMINLIKYVYRELSRVGDTVNQKFIKDRIKELKFDIKKAKPDYGAGYLIMIKAFEEVLEEDLMVIPYFEKTYS